ncbi:FAD binding domain protein [Ilyonectria sp. MPI-CAGE-AT-0026]|nr:FAD binding domain protein [Ilyonectria sp. MPI-CAGE-AT-0026]
MAPASDFKIIIVGGGIAGLTLAILLEKFDIDYVILEAHDDIAPPVGASIGMMPNGLLILDQIGCYEDVRVVAQAGEIDNLNIRASNGKSMAFIDHVLGHLESRHGYPMIFFDRQWLLEVLSNKIQHKDRVVLQSQVQRIETSESGVQVSTRNGETYHGAMVIGADGIHSVVRREMLRIAEETQSGYFPAGEEDRVPCYYQCSFGIAQKVTGWPQNEQCFTTGHHRAFLVCSGPDDRVYWFLFVKLPEVKYGKDIPRYSEEDEALFVKQHQSLLITETLTFGQVFAKRITSTLTPLHQVVFEKWFFNRLLLIGDSAHKPNPISGMGANGAMESVAEFVNALLEKRDEREEGLSGLSTEEINAICHKMQSTRHDRAKLTVSASKNMQALLAFEKPVISTLVWHVFGPLAGQDSPLRILGGRTLAGSRVNKLPIPFRPRAVPYHHELPAKPLTSGRAAIVRLLYTVVMGLLFWMAFHTRTVPSCEGSGCEDMEFIKTTGLGTGGTVDALASFMRHPLLKSDAVSVLPLIYLLSQSISPLLTYTIEGYRAGNEGTPSAFSFPYTVGLQVFGICRALPILAILTLSLPFDATAGRFVEYNVGKSLVPALAFGYIFPTLMMLAPLANLENLNAWMWAGLSQISPLLLPVLTTALSSAFGFCQQNRKKSYLDRYTISDVPILQFAYGFAFAIQATAHLAALSYGYFHLKMFTAGVSSVESEGVLGVFKSFLRSDVVLAAATITIHNLYAVWDLRRSGYTTTREAFTACLSILLGQVIAGPGATWAGLWSWRESVLSGLSVRTVR